MARTTDRDYMTDLARVVCSIPEGRIASYGAIGSQLQNPVSGLVVGRWMKHISEEVDGQTVPWWRVTCRDGTIPTFKENPALGADHVQRLRREGVTFVNEVQADFESHAFWFENDPAS